MSRARLSPVHGVVFVLAGLVVVAAAGCGRADLDTGDLPDAAVLFDASAFDAPLDTGSHTDSSDATMQDGGDASDDGGDASDDGGDASDDGGDASDDGGDASVDAGDSGDAGGCAQTECNGACVNIMTSRANCGACGNRCPRGATCSVGTCACPAGQDTCMQGTRMICVDLQTTARHCGTCTNRCTRRQACNAGVCQ